MKLKPSDIDIVAISTSDINKTLQRLIPSIRYKYYLFRRRLIPKPKFTDLRRKAKYSFTKNGDILIIDDNSPDGTSSVAKKLS